MFKRIREAIAFFRRTWRTPITGSWYSTADDEGNVQIVRSGR